MDKHAPYRIARIVRWGAALATAFLIGIVGTTEAVSANFPHFKSFSVTISSGTATTTAKAAAAAASADLPDLLFTWTEVGIGAPDVTYRLQSVVTATFGCVNTASNQPRAGNKVTVTAPVSTVSTLTSDQNGRISGSVVLDTAAVGTGDFACPPGQSLVALSATFAQNTITDTTNGVTATDDDIVVTFGP
ncbi:MAG: hypothetical protein ACRDP9_00175 [Kribbellaceae bacterium]|nr:hypothetical protein [Kribbellaceae bacterium]